MILSFSAGTAMLVLFQGMLGVDAATAYDTSKAYVANANAIWFTALPAGHPTITWDLIYVGTANSVRDGNGAYDNSPVDGVEVSPNAPSLKDATGFDSEDCVQVSKDVSPFGSVCSIAGLGSSSGVCYYDGQSSPTLGVGAKLIASWESVNEKDGYDYIDDTVDIEATSATGIEDAYVTGHTALEGNKYIIYADRTYRGNVCGVTIPDSSQRYVCKVDRVGIEKTLSDAGSTEEWRFDTSYGSGISPKNVFTKIAGSPSKNWYIKDGDGNDCNPPDNKAQTSNEGFFKCYFYYSNSNTDANWCMMPGQSKTMHLDAEFRIGEKDLFGWDDDVFLSWNINADMTPSGSTWNQNFLATDTAGRKARVYVKCTRENGSCIDGGYKYFTYK